MVQLQTMYKERRTTGNECPSSVAQSTTTTQAAPMKKAVVNEYKHTSNEELFALFRQNNERAFDELYDRYSRRLLAYCLAIVRDREIAEDMFQTAMASVFQNRDSFTGGNFEAWLFTIARNLCIKANRNKKITTPIEDFANTFTDESDKTGRDILLSDALHSALSSIPEEFAQPLMLRYFGDFSYDEIAEKTGISLSLVKVRIFRAKKLLSSKLQHFIAD